jgi:hypothetical protein
MNVVLSLDKHHELLPNVNKKLLFNWLFFVGNGLILVAGLNRSSFYNKQRIVLRLKLYLDGRHVSRSKV